MNRLEAARWTSARPTGNSHELEVGQAPTTSFASSGTRPIVVQEAPAILTSLPKPGRSGVSPIACATQSMVREHESFTPEIRVRLQDLRIGASCYLPWRVVGQA